MMVCQKSCTRFPTPMCWWGFHLSSPTFCGNSWSIQPWGFPRTFCQMIVFEQPLSFAVGVLAISTPPKFNMEPKKWWFEDDFPFGDGLFSGAMLNFQRGYVFLLCVRSKNTTNLTTFSSSNSALPTSPKGPSRSFLKDPFLFFFSGATVETMEGSNSNHWKTLPKSWSKKLVTSWLLVGPGPFWIYL